MAQTSYDYEVWIDDDVSSTLTGSFSGNAFSLGYDLSDYSAGCHFLNLHLKNADGVWGAPYRKMVLTIPNVNGAVNFEYWLDNDYDLKTEGSIAENTSSCSIPLEGMKEGLHRFSYRLQQYDGQWGSVFSKMFYYSSHLGLSNYEYWIDNDYANKVSGAISSDDYAFNVNLDNIPQKEYHFFNLRVRDGNGDWSSVYRKLFFSRDFNSPAKILGYSHTLDGVDLGYVKLENNTSGQYTFTVDVPEPAECNLAETVFSFDGDNLSYSHTDSIDYRIRIESELGWSPASAFSFESNFGYSSLAQEMTLPSALSFTRPSSWQFKAVKFTSSGLPIYLKIDHKAAIDIYANEEKVLTIPASETSDVCTINLPESTYYAVVYDVVPNTETTDPNALDIVSLRLMLENNRPSKPEISFDEESALVSIYCSDQDASIFYTLDGSVPTVENSTLYSEPINIDHNVTVSAIAVVEGLEESEMATLEINSFTTPMPQLVRENVSYVFTNSLEGATTWYTLDGSSPKSEENRIKFDGNPFEITKECTVLAYSCMENFNDSEILSVEVNPNDYTLLPPVISFIDGNIVIEHTEEGTIANYSILTDEQLDNKSEGVVGSALMPVTIDGKDYYNATVVAYASKDGWISSASATLGHSGIPTISFADNVISIEADGEVHYTLDGSIPTKESALYQGSFEIVENVIVSAVNFVGNLIPGMARQGIGVNKCESPSVKAYDGRFLYINAVPGYDILYSFNDENPLTEGFKVSPDINSETVIDLNGLNKLRAVCIADGYLPSDELSFQPVFYANESDLYTTAPHQVSEAFKWTNDYSEISELSVHGNLCDGNKEDNVDYLWLMNNLVNLKHINLTNVVDEMLPSEALSSGSLVTATLPSTLKYAGDYVFGDDNSSICAITLPASADAPSNLLEGISNPNVLVFVKEKRFAPASSAFNVNLIYGDALSADIISLTHAFPYFSPNDYHASSISYVRQFTKETSIDGVGSGWETLCVPFDVQEVRRSDDLLEPFAVDNRNGKPFWLFYANGFDWERSVNIQANTPYLIAMPCNPWYEDEYNVAGNVFFTASNTDVNASLSSYDSVGIGPETYAHVNYDMISKSEDVFALNREEVTFDTSYMPGGVFARGLDDVQPFECFIVSGSNTKYLKIFGDSNVDEILMRRGLRVWAEGKDICLTNDISSHIRIFDTIGNLVRIADVKAGEVCRISDLYSGIYIIGTQKIYVK